MRSDPGCCPVCVCKVESVQHACFMVVPNGKLSRFCDGVICLSDIYISYGTKGTVVLCMRVGFLTRLHCCSSEGASPSHGFS